MSKNNFFPIMLALALLVGFGANANPHVGQTVIQINQDPSPSSSGVSQQNPSHFRGLDRSITTVDELIQTGRLRRTQPESQKPSAQPPRQHSAPAALHMPVEVTSPKNGTSLHRGSDNHFRILNIFDANGLRSAQLRVSNDDIMVSMNERIKGGWNVSQITMNEVYLKQCIKDRCTEKVIYLGED